MISMRRAHTASVWAGSVQVFIDTGLAYPGVGVSFGSINPSSYKPGVVFKPCNVPAQRMQAMRRRQLLCKRERGREKEREKKLHVGAKALFLIIETLYLVPSPSLSF